MIVSIAVGSLALRQADFDKKCARGDGNAYC